MSATATPTSTVAVAATAAAPTSAAAAVAAVPADTKTAAVDSKTAAVATVTVTAPGAATKAGGPVVAAAGSGSTASAAGMKAVVIDGKELVPYYAIGSMMNPTSLSLRDLKPHKSLPGELKGYRLVFKGLNGMASVDADPSASTHGVLHYLTCAEMAALDRIEASYRRLWVDIHLYDGAGVVQGWVYQMDDARFPAMTAGPHNPPSERYVDVITRGAKHYGVQPAFVAWLATVPVVPRRAPKDFKTIPDPKGVFATHTVTCAEFAKMDGVDGRPLGVSINGKVLRFCGDRSTAAGASTFDWARTRFTGRDSTLQFARMLYDPLYPVCTRLCDMSAEHRASCEDFYANNWTGQWEAVGRLCDIPADF